LKNRPKKKKQTSVHVAVLVGVVIIVLSVFFVYSNDQAKIRGEAFSKAIEFVQEDLRKTYHSFDSKVSMFNQSNITKDDFLKFAEKHELEMEKIILRYDNLQTPQPFVPAVKLFKLSAETQFEADKYIIEWIRTGDDTARIRSVSSYDQSLQYEQAGLFEFNLVQRQVNP
tara:strand:- start:846 stop:1355 length:510 start_codon:yes stop_codon:yes gene_type:complete